MSEAVGTVVKIIDAMKLMTFGGWSLWGFFSLFISLVAFSGIINYFFRKAP